MPTAASAVRSDGRMMRMKSAKKQRLEASGWKVGTVGQLLDLTPEEEAFVEAKLRLAELVRARRQVTGLTQSTLAKRMASSQSRIAKIEAGGASVSVDLMIRALFAAGATASEIGAAIAGRPRRSKA